MFPQQNQLMTPAPVPSPVMMRNLSSNYWLAEGSISVDGGSFDVSGVAGCSRGAGTSEAADLIDSVCLSRPLTGQSPGHCPGSRQRSQLLPVVFCEYACHGYSFGSKRNRSPL